MDIHEEIIIFLKVLAEAKEKGEHEFICPSAEQRPAGAGHRITTICAAAVLAAGSE